LHAACDRQLQVRTEPAPSSTRRQFVQLLLLLLLLRLAFMPRLLRGHTSCSPTILVPSSLSLLLLLLLPLLKRNRVDLIARTTLLPSRSLKAAVLSILLQHQHSLFLLPLSRFSHLLLGSSCILQLLMPVLLLLLLLLLLQIWAATSAPALTTFTSRQRHPMCAIAACGAEPPRRCG
jgi:hypothetical protein